MHKSYNSGESSTTADVVRMEINGHPYYTKSKGNVPYLYDIDTHDEVGYWSSKKGQYVMFSLYNRMMKQKQFTESKGCDDDDDGDDDSETTETESSSKSQDESSSKSQEDDADDDSSSKSQDEDDYELESDSESEANTHVTRETQKTRMDTYSLIFVFFMLFVYLTLQKEFQSIYFDFVFLILINLMNTLKVFEFMNEE
jgi:hypothetical protein